MCSDHRDQKRVSEHLEVELQMVGSCHVGAENQTILWKSSQCCQPLRQLSNPFSDIFISFPVYLQRLQNLSTPSELSALGTQFLPLGFTGEKEIRTLLLVFSLQQF